MPLWTGREFSAAAVLFLVFDGVTKALRVNPAMDATVTLGYPASAIPVVSTILLVCTALYVIPRTSFHGPTLLTAYLHGAVAVNVRLFGLHALPIAGR